MVAPLPDITLASPHPPPLPSLVNARRLRTQRLGRALRLWVPVGVLILILAFCFLLPLVVTLPSSTSGNIIYSNEPPFSPGHLLGTDVQGVDLFSQLVYGGQVAFEVGVSVTVIGIAIGGTLGVIAGYFGGWVDSLIARAMDVFLAFPLLVFALALAGVIPSSGFGLSGNTLRIAVLIFVIGFFNWPYMGRIIRGQTLSLREREFVDAARSLGARGPYILFRELLPNLVAPILVYTTLLIPTNILFEAALDYLGVGLYVPTPTWGQMLASAVQNGYYSIDPEFMLVPGLTIFITVMAFNLFGDGLRDALDPRTR
jgi:peptide/nickel transport system permease protein